MNKEWLNRQYLFTATALAAVLCLFEFTNLDLAVQDILYLDQSGRWLIDGNERLWRFLLYDGIKGALILLGVVLLTGILASIFFAPVRALRSRMLLLLLALAFVPFIIAGLKSYTNVYCPSQLQRYGGDKPYVKVFEAYPSGFSQKAKGRCFPAGHASGGFALMALYFVARNKRAKRLGLFAGLSAGWAMGLYQMAKGAHFLSHTVVTMLGAWLIILIIYQLAGGEEAESQARLQSVS